MKYGILLAVLSWLCLGSCKQDIIPHDAAGFDTGGDIGFMSVTATKPGSLSGDRFINVSEGQVYDLDEASLHPENIDLAVLYGASSGLNIVAPADIARLDAWGTGQTMNDTWLVKNKSTLVKLDSSAAATAVFDSIKTAGQLRDTYQNVLENMPATADEAVNGPAQSLHTFKAGDVIFVRSEDRNFYAALQVTAANPQSSGSATFAIKVDNNTLVNIPPADTLNRMTVYEAALDSPGYNAGNRCLDLATGMVYNMADAVSWQEKVDMILFNGTSSGFNLVVPTEEGRLNLFGSGKTVNTDWLVKNEGTLLRLDASPQTDSLFLFTVNNEMIKNAYTKAAQDIPDKPGYDVETDGPGGYLYGLHEGDVILFKSVSKNIYAMAKVTALTTGGKGSLTLSVKADNSARVDVAPPPARDLDMFAARGTSSNSRYIDLITGTDYDETTATEITENIDLIFATGSNSLVNLFTPTSDGALKAFSSAWLTRVSGWPVRNDGLLINLGSAAEYAALYDGLKEGDTAAIRQAYEDAGKNITPADRITSINTGDIILFRSVGRKLYAAIKVIESVRDGGLHIKFKVARE